jgi:large subunit ribosomal protein L13Ae
MFNKVVVIDGKGHLMGRLASYVAKQLLSGIYPLIKAKELLSLDAKLSTSPDHYLEIKSNSHNS